jgi:hypothetical protein
MINKIKQLFGIFTACYVADYVSRYIYYKLEQEKKKAELDKFWRETRGKRK